MLDQNAVITEAQSKPSAIDCKDALDDCKRAVGMLRCIIGATDSVDVEDKTDAVEFVTNYLETQVSIIRAHFEMDKEEAASC